MSTPNMEDAAVVWETINKEITGIQLLWETVSELYFSGRNHGWQNLSEDARIFYALTQTTYMESLLVRVYRLMDRSSSGNNNGQRSNLSLARLVQLIPDAEENLNAVKVIWDNSQLKAVRNKYLSHNDLDRLLSEPHTVNAPMTDKDTTALANMVIALRDFRKNVTCMVDFESTFLDSTLDIAMQSELNTLNNTLLGGELLFQLLPDDDSLAEKWHRFSGEHK